MKIADLRAWSQVRNLRLLAIMSIADKYLTYCPIGITAVSLRTFAAFEHKFVILASKCFPIQNIFSKFALRNDFINQIIKPLCQKSHHA